MVAHLILLLALAGPGHGDTINAVIGDASASVTIADEVLRIRTHLQFVHAKLSQDGDHLTASQRRRRTAALATLDRYIARGVFPRRTVDAHPGRRPRFIDDRGVHCAVGFLIAEAGAPELARTINAAHEYDYVHDITDPRLVAWAASNGFTVDELAMIQPTYAGRLPPTPHSIERRLHRSAESFALACPTKRAARTAVELHVTGDQRGRATATAKSTDAFARCIAEHASRIERGAENCDSAACFSQLDFRQKPTPYELDITLQIDSPQALLERRFVQADLDRYCTPRPGEIPERAKVKVSTSKDGLAIAVATTPPNTEIDRCIAERTRSHLDVFARIPDLAAEREIQLVSRLATDHFRQQLQMTARSIAMACYEGKQPTATIQLTLSAKRDDASFTIKLATRDKKLVACMRDKLPAYLSDAYSISRRVEFDKTESYFRIDADIKVTVPIILIEPTPPPHLRKPTYHMAL